MSVFTRRRPSAPEIPPDTSNATPRPWSVFRMGNGLAVVKGAGGQSIASLLGESDAQLIVDAVNERRPNE